MSVVQDFITNKSYINGVECTEENEQSLVDDDIRRSSTYHISRTISAIDGLWSGLPDLPERDRIVQLLRNALSEVQQKEQQPWKPGNHDQM